MLDVLRWSKLYFIEAVSGNLISIVSNNNATLIYQMVNNYKNEVWINAAQNMYLIHLFLHALSYKYY